MSPRTLNCWQDFVNFCGLQEENMNFKSPLFSIFRWPLLPFGQNRKIPSGTGMAIFTWHSSKIWIRVTNPGQCGLPCCMFLPPTVGWCRVCLLSVPFNILQIYTNLFYLSHSICQYDGKKEEVKINQEYSSWKQNSF